MHYGCGELIELAKVVVDRFTRLDIEIVGGLFLESAYFDIMEFDRVSLYVAVVNGDWRFGGAVYHFTVEFTVRGVQKISALSLVTRQILTSVILALEGQVCSVVNEKSVRDLSSWSKNWMIVSRPNMSFTFTLKK